MGGNAKNSENTLPRGIQNGGIRENAQPHILKQQSSQSTGANPQDARPKLSSPQRIVGVVSYHGGVFCGWQIQPDQPTVQGALEAALKKVTRQSIGVVGSGRTDSGVHGVGQVFHFDYQGTIPPEAFTPALNSYLPRSVRVSATWIGTSDFHARFSATLREYRYYIGRSSALYPPGGGGVTPGMTDAPLLLNTPGDSSSCWRIRNHLDIHKLNEYAHSLVGTHDFTALSAAGDPSPSKIRDIYGAWWYPQGEFLVFRIVGRSFLWRMVRSIVGTSVEFAREGLPGDAMAKLLASGRREDAGTTAPADGLFLYKVGYPKAVAPDAALVADKSYGCQQEGLGRVGATHSGGSYAT